MKEITIVSNSNNLTPKSAKGLADALVLLSNTVHKAHNILIEAVSKKQTNYLKEVREDLYEFEQSINEANIIYKESVAKFTKEIPE